MTTVAEDPRLPFLASLDLPSCRIEYAAAPIVLICGGRVPDPKPYADALDPPIASLRHAISNAHPTFEVFCPEEIKNWHSDAVFKDLVSFERALASVCSLIVIILESAGSMVELGAFSQLTELADKSITICSNKFVEDDSFINLGILRFLAAKNPSRVKNYNWEPLQPQSITDEIVIDVVSDIQDELDRLPKTAILKSDQDSHCMVVISELLRLFAILKEHEIHDYLITCGYHISIDQLREKLFLLKFFRIVKTEKYSDATFYVSGSEQYHRLRLVAIDKIKPIDALRIEAQCLDFYKSTPKYKNWNRAVAQARKGAAK
ncbi:MAG: hypothetical protein EON58_00270 [Alphaproteobacteria bacterium]|nr:MAG: hypothetical protein EON58_00270 [Alphaproteobacteria bacterium]